MKYQLLNLFDESPTLPSSDFNCKFILIRDSDTLWLVFGSLSTYRYHAQLVQRFCVINDINYSWVKKDDLLDVLDDDIDIKGGGFINFDEKKQLLDFTGYSTAYGKFDKVILEEFILNCAETRGLKVLIGT